MPTAFEDNTAGRLLRLLGETDGTGSPRGPLSLPRSWALVRCESATPADAADVGGVGEVCYPGTIVDQHAEEAEQTERGAVWLSLLAGDGYATPAAGAVYPCALLGYVEAATGDTRVRAVGSAAGQTVGGWGCAQAVAWGAGDCLALSVVAAAGRCSAIDTDQTLTLEWLPRQRGWGSGDSAETDPEDDFVHDNGLGPALLWFSDGWPYLTLDGVHGMFAGCDGECLLFRFGGPVLCGGAGDGCEDNTFSVRVCCACCDGDTGYTTPGWYCLPGGCENLTAEPCGRVATSGPHATQQDCEDECCAIEGWDGEGWYCVETGHGGGPCESVELLEADMCDDTIQICSGPYASEAAADAECSCAPCRDTVGFRVVVASVSDGTCSGESTSGLAAFNGTWVFSGQWVDVPGGTSYWQPDNTPINVGFGLIVNDPATWPLDYGYVAFDLACDPATGVMRALVTFLVGPDTVAQYADSVLCCGSGGVSQIDVLACGNWPASVTVEAICEA